MKCWLLDLSEKGGGSFAAASPDGGRAIPSFLPIVHVLRKHVFQLRFPACLDDVFFKRIRFAMIFKRFCICSGKGVPVLGDDTNQPEASGDLMLTCHDTKEVTALHKQQVKSDV